MCAGVRIIVFLCFDRRALTSCTRVMHAFAAFQRNSVHCRVTNNLAFIVLTLLCLLPHSSFFFYFLFFTFLLVGDCFSFKLMDSMEHVKAS